MKVLVTNCTKNSTLTVMRALSSAGVEIVGADERRLPFDLHSRCAAPYETISNANSPDFIDDLNHIINKYKPDVLLPFGAAIQASQAKETLCRETNMLIPDLDTFVAVNDKRLLLEQCNRHSIPCPELLHPEHARQELQKGSFEAVVVKPRRNLGGGEGVTFVTDPDKLYQVVADIEKRFGEVLVMQYIPGPDSNNIALQVVFDRKGKPIGYFSLQKTRLQPARVGISAAAISVHRTDLLAMIAPMFARLRWQGPADIEFKIDSRTGKAWLIEINARFSGAVGFAIGCGINLPLLTCKAALGQKLPEVSTPEYRAGVKYWNPIAYIRAIRTAAFSGEFRSRLPGQIMRELRGERVGNPYHLSDPAPLIGKGLRQIHNWFRKIQPGTFRNG